MAGGWASALGAAIAGGNKGYHEGLAEQRAKEDQAAQLKIQALNAAVLQRQLDQDPNASAWQIEKTTDPITQRQGFTRINAKTGESQIVNPAPGDGQVANAPKFGDDQPHGEEFLKTLDPATAASVKAYANYTAAMPSSYGLKDPRLQNLLNVIVPQYDPTFNAQLYGPRQGLLKDFTSGKESQNRKSLNALVGHLGSLKKEAEKLNNGSTPALNWVENKFIDATGDPRVGNYLTTSNAAEEELTRFLTGVGATNQEIQNWRQRFGENKSPEQFQGFFGSLADLVDKQAQAQQQKWTTGMGKTEGFAPYDAGMQDAVGALRNFGAPAAGAPQASAPPQGAGPGAPPPLAAGGTVSYADVVAKAETLPQYKGNPQKLAADLIAKGVKVVRPNEAPPPAAVGAPPSARVAPPAAPPPAPLQMPQAPGAPAKRMNAPLPVPGVPNVEIPRAPVQAQSTSPMAASLPRGGGPMEISPEGLAALKSEREGGFYETPYQDAGTGLAIGYGMHTWKGKPVTPDLRITQQDADSEMLNQIKNTYAPIVDKNLKVPVTQAQYDALISMTWNSPAAAKAIIVKLNKGQALTAADFQKSATVKGKANKGLQGRRAAEAAPFLKPNAND